MLQRVFLHPDNNLIISIKLLRVFLNLLLRNIGVEGDGFEEVELKLVQILDVDPSHFGKVGIGMIGIFPEFAG